jgi:tRNA pseudouridine55 synthase
VIEGFVVVDKPAGITSHDVVAAVRAVTGVKKVGHTGTLDPFATGVLPLALGRCTRLIQYLDESIKIYDARIRLGSATDTGDPTGEVVREAPLPEADEAGVRAVLDDFLGEQEQTPPAYSAVKVKGKPLYHYARKGEKVEVKARRITIHALELVSYDREVLEVRITCSRGTYARVLADDIAVALGSAGHLENLGRSRSGPFVLDDAVDMPTLAGMVAAEEGHDWRDVLLSRRKGDRVPWRPRAEVEASLRPHLLSPLRCLSHLPLADVGTDEARRVRSGGSLPPPPRGVAAGGRYAVVQGDDLVAIAEHSARGGKALRVL